MSTYLYEISREPTSLSPAFVGHPRREILSGARLAQSDLLGATLVGAQLEGTDLSGADLTQLPYIMTF